MNQEEQIRTGDVITMDRKQGTVMRLGGCAVEVQFFDSSMGYSYKWFSSKDLKKKAERLEEAK